MGVAAEHGAARQSSQSKSHADPLLIAPIAAGLRHVRIGRGGERAPKDMALLTVSGTIGETNRACSPLRRTACSHCRRFPKAFAFDRAMPLALEQGTVTAQLLEFDTKGPLLRDVLGRVQAPKMKITVLAIDGY